MTIENAVAENVLGTIGTIMWTGQIIPQIVKSYREKSTNGLSPHLMFIWAVSAVFLGIYVIVQNISIPIIIQPQLFGALAALSWTQCLYYDGGRSKLFCISVFVSFVLIFVGFEVGMVYATRAIMHTKGDQHLLRFLGVFSGVLIVVGLVPQYIEIYRLKEVRGISLLFMAIDILGGVFSILSLVFKAHFDWIASFTYISVVVLDGGIVLLAFILNPRAKRRQAAQAQIESGTSATLTNHRLSNDQSGKQCTINPSHQELHSEKHLSVIN